MKLPLILISLLLLTYKPVTAQPVKAILVQFNSEQNKIRYFLKTGNSKEAANVSGEAAIITKKIANDFNDNFNYCPVYYFIDTNTSLIKNKQFNGLLLNANGTPAKNIVINSSDSDYLIVCYGYSDASSAMSTCKGITVSSSQFRKLFFFPSCDPANPEKGYRYISPKYDISYYPSAKELDSRIKRRYNE